MAITSSYRPPRAPDPIHVLRGHRTDTKAVAFLGQGHLLLSGDADGEVKLWDLGTRRPISSVRAHLASAGVIGLAGSKLNSLQFLSQGRDGVVKVWALTESALARQPLLVIESGSYNFCKLSLAEASTRPLQIADARRGPPSREEDVRRDEGGKVPGVANRAVEMQEPRLLSEGRVPENVDEGRVRPEGKAPSQSTEEGTERGGFEDMRAGSTAAGGGLSAVLRSNGSGLAAGLQMSGQGSTAAGARSTGGGGEGGAEIGVPPSLPPQAAADSVQQLIAVAGAEPSTIEIWDVRSGQLAQRIEQPRREDLAGGLRTDTPSAGMCMSVQLRLDSEVTPSPVAVGGYEDGSVMAWDLRSTAAPLIRQRLHTEPVLSLALDQLGSGGVSGSADDKLIFFSLRYQEGQVTVAKEIGLQRPGVGDIALRDDQRIVASAGWDNRVRIFDYKSRSPLAVLRYHSAAVTAVTFSPGGHLLASASRDASIALWSLYPPKVPDRQIAIGGAL